MLMGWLQQRVRSFGYAFSGLGMLFHSQSHAKIHLVSACFVVVAGGVLNITMTQWAIVLLTIALVVSAEALNTAIEFLADAVHPEHHPLVGQAKDVAAAAVLISSIFAVVIGAIVFVPALFSLLDI